MTALTRLVADYALYAVALVALLSWVRTPRSERVPFAAAVIIAAILVGVAVKTAGALWVDPRPFVVDHTAPLIAHSADNGFPSDHTALATAIAGVVFAWHRRTGAALLVVAVLLGTSRVAAHVHHVPDVVVGLLIGVLAALVGTIVARHIPWHRMRWVRSLTVAGRHPAT